MQKKKVDTKPKKKETGNLLVIHKTTMYHQIPPYIVTSITCLIHEDKYFSQEGLTLKYFVLSANEE